MPRIKKSKLSVTKRKGRNNLWCRGVVGYLDLRVFLMSLLQIYLGSAFPDIQSNSTVPEFQHSKMHSILLPEEDITTPPAVHLRQLLDEFKLVHLIKWGSDQSEDRILGNINHDPTYTNRWATMIEGGSHVAKNIARDLGYTYKGQSAYFEDYYELVNQPEVSKSHSVHLTRNLLDLEEVKWAKQQRSRKIVYKELPSNNNFNVEYEEEALLKYTKKEANAIAEDPTGAKSENIFSRIRLPIGFRGLFKSLENISNMRKFSTGPASHSQLYKYTGPTKNIQLLSQKISAYKKKFNDPLWTKQWYVQDYRTTDIPVMDHNVVPVYKMGYTGKGVIVAVLDTELQFDHPDLKDNIDIEKSYDICLDKPLKDVLMQYKNVDVNHGTECAGIISMVANNGKCGVGIAYNAKIAAIILECKNKPVTEVEESRALLQNFEMIDILSNSWGADDDPTKVCALAEMNSNAYKKGTTEGRNGKGLIYIHSAGNGGDLGDNCATDCMINQVYVMAITSANQYGKRSDYSEKCTAIFATAYSGNHIQQFERTVSLIPGSGCTEDFSGTSASCPLAAGLIALTLEANRELSYRDVMHIVARSAEVAPLADNDSWQINGHGFWVSLEFGFGLMNAKNMVVLAKTWIQVPEKHMCTVNIKPDTPKPLDWKKKVSITFDTEACQSSPTDSVFYLEHVEVASIVEYPRRGHITLYITSPYGTRSLLLGERLKDEDKDGLEGWPIMSVHNWGENPKGKWIIDVEIIESELNKKLTGLVKEFTVKFHGMGVRPFHLNQRRGYAAFRLPNGITEDGRNG